jgi:hypothetical protein
MRLKHFQRLLLLKGAAEIVLSRCNRVVIDGKEVAFAANDGSGGGDDTHPSQPGAPGAPPSPLSSATSPSKASRASILSAMQHLMSGGERLVVVSSNLHLLHNILHRFASICTDQVLLTFAFSCSL